MNYEVDFWYIIKYTKRIKLYLKCYVYNRAIDAVFCRWLTMAMFSNFCPKFMRQFYPKLQIPMPILERVSG